jgi:outer membrane protein OmpA-like peptidoglycan-associated protein
MFSQDDDSTGLVLGVLFGIIALVISLVIGVSIYQRNKTMAAQAVATSTVGEPAGLKTSAVLSLPAAPAAASGVELADEASIMVEGGVVKFFFASGKSELASGSAQALSGILAGASAGKKVLVSGYVDNTGNADKNKEIAKQRAFAVRDLLKSAGIADDKIELKKPEDIKAGTGVQARRVEVSLQ